MKKIKNQGFMLAETLIVTSFVAGVLIFLFIQISTLGKKYQDSYSYNTVEDLYALEDIANYIESDTVAYTYIEENINDSYMDITDCSIFLSKDYCTKLFQLENVDKVLVSVNDVDINDYKNYSDEEFLNFISKISKEGKEKYRLIASFKNSTYATIRFGE